MTATKTIEPCLGFPVRFDPLAKVICDSRGIWRWKEIVVGPLFFSFPPAEQAAMLLHEAGHCKLRHIEKRLVMLFTRPWKVSELCREQEFEADRFVRAIGCGSALASAFRRMGNDTRSPLYPALDERIHRLI